MNRRDFIRLLIASPIAAKLDVEKLLWVPEKTIFIPPVDIRISRIFGIPYHYTDASTGTWLGISRVDYVKKELTEMITILNKEKVNG